MLSNQLGAVRVGWPAEPTACLVSSDDIGEGMFIAEVALRDDRLGMFLLRSSKAFVDSRWDSSEPRILLDSRTENSNCKLRNANCKLRASVVGQFAIGNFHFAICNSFLQSLPYRDGLGSGGYDLTANSLHTAKVLRNFKLFDQPPC
jgi:hypothetical protein